MKELVVISGKGGTGKTSLTAGFAVLAGRSALADCDVDAADLPLLLQPRLRRREEFRCGHEAIVRQEICIGCGACLARCRFDAVIRRNVADDGFVQYGKTPCDQCADGCKRSCPVKYSDQLQAIRALRGDAPEHAFFIDPVLCEGCGACVDACPVDAIDFPERVAGEWYVSDTAHGPMAHARLEPGGENSGKLVTKVRETARALAGAEGLDLLLTDGPPGIGCPVIATLTGASLALAVTEPTVSGAHDLDRVLALTRHFGVPAMICVNKWDLHPAQTEAMERAAQRAGARLAGRIRYDRSVVTALVSGKSIVAADGPAAGDARAVWKRVEGTIGNLKGAP